MASASASAHADIHHAAGSLTYLSGFGNEHASEALPGALPVGQNAPQKCPYGLYAEQLSGTAFTVPRARNQRSWLYRVHPSVMHARFVPVEHAALSAAKDGVLDPNQMRWAPLPLPPGGDEGDDLDFVDGLHAMMGAGEPSLKSGMAVLMYACNKSMVDTAMQNSDGDFLIVPQVGVLHLQTEFGWLDVAPREIAVVQRGIRFRVSVDGPSRGYICEVFGGHFQLPDLGPLGANGLANPRDFLFPVAAWEDREVDYVLVNKYGGSLWSTTMVHSPFNVVAWHGNYAPYKYNLERFNTMNSVSYDHPDPSIYTVLTCPTDTPGVALADFVVFPPRWMVMEHTFRPPYFHRNTMSEFMGMVWGKYDAKVGFQAGGASLHSTCTPHGPDADTFMRASHADLKPERFDGGLAFMFETSLMMRLTPWALTAPHREVDYQKVWQTLPRTFEPGARDMGGRALVPKSHPLPGSTSGSARGPVTDAGSAPPPPPPVHAPTGSAPAGGAGEADDGEGGAGSKRRRGGS